MLVLEIRVRVRVGGRVRVRVRDAWGTNNVWKPESALAPARAELRKHTVTCNVEVLLFPCLSEISGTK